MARFLFFGINYAPESLGNAPYSTAYAEALARAGHDVTFVTGYPHYPQWNADHRRWRIDVTEANGVRLVRVPHAVPTTPTALGRLRLEASYGLASMAGWLRGGPSADATIGVIPSLSGALAARVAGFALRVRAGLLVQDMVAAAAAQGGVEGASPTVARAVGAVERLVMRGADIAVVARGFEAPAREYGARDVTFLPNFWTGVPALRRTRAETRERVGIPADVFLVTYSGSLGYKQDFSTVIAAAERLSGDSSIEFLVVGEGAQEAPVRAAFDERRVRGRWLPLQPIEEVAEVLAASDVLLAPQRPTAIDMSIPSKLTAYLASGRPVIAGASAQSETARLVEESGGGIVVPPSHPAALAEAIQRLHNEASARHALGAAGREYALATFDRTRAEQRFVAWAERLTVPALAR